MTNLPTSDPVVQLGRQIAELDARCEQLDDLRLIARKADDLSAADYYETALGDLQFRIETLKDAMSCYEAQSLEGAMIHVARAVDLVCVLDDVIEEPDYQTRELQRAIKRMLFSAQRRLERSAESDLRALGLDCLCSDHLDPWVSVEERLAAIKAPDPEAKAA